MENFLNFLFLLLFHKSLMITIKFNARLFVILIQERNFIFNIIFTLERTWIRWNLFLDKIFIRKTNRRFLRKIIVDKILCKTKFIHYVLVWVIILELTLQFIIRYLCLEIKFLKDAFLILSLARSIILNNIRLIFVFERIDYWHF